MVVVSEETSRISVARLGRLERDVSPDRLRSILQGVSPGNEPILTPGVTGVATQ